MGNPAAGGRREGRGRFIHSTGSTPALPPSAPHPPPPAPATKPKSTRRTASATGTGRMQRATLPAPKKKDNTLLIVGGAAGGLFFLIVIIAVAASSGNKPRPVEKKPVEEPVVVEEKSTVTKQDTGPITFACAGGGQHPEKESSVTRCPKCNARSRFYWDYKANKFSCFDCKALFEKADIRCPDCGGVPNRDPYIKHRPG